MEQAAAKGWRSRGEAERLGNSGVLRSSSERLRNSGAEELRI